ncbi:hypothetical protein QE374_000698 [Microbacterium sp. SORGH_AS428]|uniref:DUF4184 family protein n=1 Tax=Microbacterium sp. SORGH_AS_0428 TaxID=3041788 RepID=UPI0028650CF3|nr:DUF4184 family protein [Microbacterium sp. SORGH_AS_0428]MDR6198789.1 hypothetical protein [Microbacterium sp. SORGH_AS_0428]
MPFTPSHAVLALPFVRTPLAPAAVAVGAMTPDLPLFVRGLPVTYGLTHDLRWLPVTAMLALALLLLWRALLRPAARELAPGPLAERLPAGWDAPVRTIWRETFGASATAALLLAASLMIGVASHIAWDAFTHEGRLGSQLFPALEEPWGPLPGIKWLQHGSSAIGLGIIAVWALLWLRRRPRVPYAPRTPRWVGVVWVASLPAVLIAAWVIGLAAYGPLTSEFTVAHLAYRVLPQACAVWAAATLVLCGFVVWRRSRGVASR